MFDWLRKKKVELPSLDGKLICRNHYQEMLIRHSQEPQSVGIQCNQLCCEFCVEEGSLNPAIGVLIVNSGQSKPIGESERENNSVSTSQSNNN